MSYLSLAYAKPSQLVRASRYEYGADDGYDWMEIAGKRGFQSFPGWGLDGWDLGDWPLVIYSLQRINHGYVVAEHVEGDLRFETFETREDAYGRLDSALLFYNDYARAALLEDLDGDPLPTHVDDLPDRFRGPFSWHRLNQEKGDTCNLSCKVCWTVTV